MTQVVEHDDKAQAYALAVEHRGAEQAHRGRAPGTALEFPLPGGTAVPGYQGALHDLDYPGVNGKCLGVWLVPDLRIREAGQVLGRGVKECDTFFPIDDDNAFL